MDAIAAVLDETRRAVNGAMERFLAAEAPRSAPAAGWAPIAEAYDILCEFTLRPGKRLRPILMIVGYRALGGQDEQAILRAACCLELTQSMLLIHDDIMDKSALRRGLPTVHTAVAARYAGQAADPEHFGMALAIAVGDLVGQLALRALLTSSFAPAPVAQALDVYTKITRDVCYGQVLDMHAGAANLPLDERAVLTINELKTARYTTEGPLHLGAVLAGAGQATLDGLSAYARPAGQAFQLQDDVLGVFGSQTETGKPADADLKQGKRTLLVIKALEMGSPAQRQALLAVLGNERATHGQVGAARQALEDSGARRYCELLASRLAGQARQALVGIGLQPAGAAFLDGLVDYLVRRRQ